jgi:cytochrome c-type biogenesis protein CcmE
MTEAPAPQAATQKGRVPRAARILLTVAVVGGGLGYLLYATASEDVEFYKHVDEVQAKPDAYRGKRLQLHGHVKEGSILRRAQGTAFEYRFTLEHNGASVPAHHQGSVPDAFKDGAEVVLRGRFAPSGTFEVGRGGITTVCPSKYEAKKRK